MFNSQGIVHVEPPSSNHYSVAPFPDKQSQLFHAHNNASLVYPWHDTPVNYRTGARGRRLMFEENFPDFWSERYTGGPIKVYHSHPLALKLLHMTNPPSYAHVAPGWRRPNYYTVHGNPFR